MTSDLPQAIIKNPDPLAVPQLQVLFSKVGIDLQDLDLFWLGNDETHYVRKWEEKDIRDLKILIRLTESWIQNSILTDKYLREMGGGA